VELLDELLKRGWLEESDFKGGSGRTTFKLTEKGQRSLQDLNVRLAREVGSKRLYAYGCLDWTERRYHLGGLLGKAVLDSLLADGIVERAGRRKVSRAVTVRKPILAWLTAR
jgi:DNA-binding PadR family transcriptional regulator